MSKKDYVVFSVASGVVALVTFVFPAQVIGMFAGLIGASPSYVLYEMKLGPALAKDARSRLARPLTESQIRELKTDIHECAKPANPPFCSLVEKYAMMGEVHAQLVMGTMNDVQYTDFEKSQRVDWLKVAFAQGGLPILLQANALIRATTPQDPNFKGDITKLVQGAMRDPNITFPQLQALLSPIEQNVSPAYNPAASMPQPGINTAQDEAIRQALLENAMAPNPQMPIYHSAPDTIPSAPQFPESSQSQPTRILTPSGPQNYVDQDGTVYAGAGPHGVVNTQTGEFTPTN